MKKVLWKSPNASGTAHCGSWRGRWCVGETLGLRASYSMGLVGM